MSRPYNGRKIHDIERHKNLCNQQKNSFLSSPVIRSLAYVDDGNELEPSFQHIVSILKAFFLPFSFFLFAITMKHFVTVNERYEELHHPATLWNVNTMKIEDLRVIFHLACSTLDRHPNDVIIEHLP